MRAKFASYCSRHFWARIEHDVICGRLVVQEVDEEIDQEALRCFGTE